MRDSEIILKACFIQESAKGPELEMVGKENECVLRLVPHSVDGIALFILLGNRIVCHLSLTKDECYFVFENPRVSIKRELDGFKLVVDFQERYNEKGPIEPKEDKLFTNFIEILSRFWIGKPRKLMLQHNEIGLSVRQISLNLLSDFSLKNYISSKKKDPRFIEKVEKMKTRLQNRDFLYSISQ